MFHLFRSTDTTLSIPALHCIVSALESGSVHPVLCVPSLCALESNPDTQLSIPAFTIHKKLHEKHSSFIHTKTVESIHCVYNYQVSFNGPDAPGTHFKSELIEYRSNRK